MSAQNPHTLVTTSRATSPEEGEHRAAMVRVRLLFFAGMPAWVLGTHLDFVADANLAPGSLPRLLPVRALGVLVILGAWVGVRLSPRMSPGALRAVLVGTLTVVGALLGLMAAIAGGLTAPYFEGALVVLASYAVVSQERWRLGVVDLAWVASGFPAALFLAGLAFPSIAPNLADPRERATLIFDLTNLASMYAIALVGGHVAWSLRRQVFEARSLGRYKLKTLIGEGGMGEVWLAYHNGLKRDVAVKILRTLHLRDTERATRRFEREVRATTELNHPNTVRVLDYGVTDDGLWYYVMELLVGENLAQLVLREGSQPAARAIHIVGQAARALAEAHAKGIVHRDVKPENLVLTEAGFERDFVKVVDFGIAKVVTTQEDATLTAEGRVLGTPRWLPPEGFAAKTLGPPADVYALGAVLHLLLSGHPPFEGDNLAALANAHLNLPPAPLPATVPADLAAVVLRCLAKSPDERYATARELAAALDACSDAGRWRPPGSSAVRVARGVPGVDVLGKTEDGTPLASGERGLQRDGTSPAPPERGLHKNE